MTTRTRSLSTHLLRAAAAAALVAWSGAARADAAPVAALHAQPTKADAALQSCSRRADLLFVRRCVQACMIDSKSRTRVLQDTVGREECQQQCGRQKQLALFVDACMQRAGYAAPAASPAGARPAR